MRYNPALLLTSCVAGFGRSLPLPAHVLPIRKARPRYMQQLSPQSLAQFMKRSLAFALLFGFLISFSACDAGTQCGPFDSRFVTTDFTSGAFEFELDDSLRLDPNVLPPPELSPVGEDTLSHSDFSIQMRADIETFASRRERGMSFSLVSSAYACSPALPTSEEVIEDIQIYSDEDFNDDYAAGDNLAELFDILVPIRVDAVAYHKFDLNDFLSTNPNPTGEIILLLKEPPQTVSDLQFTVQYTQQSEALDYYEFETSPVVLKPN